MLIFNAEKEIQMYILKRKRKKKRNNLMTMNDYFDLSMSLMLFYEDYLIKTTAKYDNLLSGVHSKTNMFIKYILNKTKTYFTFPYS
jgi:hypothetical protein